jgi:hypothetical protein
MNLTELKREDAAAPHKPLHAVDPRRLLAQLGAEVAGTLSSALQRVQTLIATGRIDKNSLRTLYDELEHARRVAMTAQQATRFGSGRLQITREQIDLTALVIEAVQQQGGEFLRRGLDLRPVCASVQVVADAALATALLQSLLEWAAEHAQSAVDLRLDVKPAPAHARLVCAFAHQPSPQGEAVLTDTQPSPLETMSWSLLQQTAVVMGLELLRHDTSSRTTVTIEFPDTLVQHIDGLYASELDGDTSQAYATQPLAGRHVLVLAGRREVRNMVREALRPMGLMIDFVGSVEEAEAFCEDGLPHAMVYESSLAGERFERLRSAMLADVPTLAFVQLAEDGKPFEVLSIGGRQFASVGRDAIVESLPAAMLYEMAHADGDDDGRAAPAVSPRTPA